MNKQNRLEQFKRMLEKNPGNSLIRYSIANEYFKFSDYENAIKQLLYYLSSYSDEGAGYRLLAESYMETGKTELAKEAYKKGIHAAKRHGHPGMADEFEDALMDIDKL